MDTNFFCRRPWPDANLLAGKCEWQETVITTLWRAHCLPACVRASRVLAMASSLSRTFVGAKDARHVEPEAKFVSTRHRNQHAGSVRYPLTDHLLRITGNQATAADAPLDVASASE